MRKLDITVNDKHYTQDQIINGTFETSTVFEKSTLAFCRSWLTGQTEFTLQTSGSTGIPKKISFTRDQMAASAAMTQAALNLKAGDTALVCLDTKYIAGQMMLVRCFVTGMNIIAVEPTANPLEKVDAIRKINFTALVPYQLQNILSTHQAQFDDIDTAIIGGAPVDNLLKEKLQGVKCKVYATYGMTETLSHIGLMNLNNTVTDYFSALPGVEIGKDDRGCLIIKTDFLNVPVITNDLVDIKNNDQFRWLGRWDNVINTGGIKVMPEKLESQLEAILHQCGVENRFFISGLPDANLGQRICLVIESSPMHTSDLDQLRKEMKTNLAKYEVPKEIRFIEKFVQTETGKVNRLKTINLYPA